MKAIDGLANHCTNLAVAVGNGPHVFCYDNINLSTSDFVEQRGSATPAKVTSGTFPILYKVCNGTADDMKLAPILERLRKCKGLEFNGDLRPTIAQMTSFQSQLQVVVVRVLTKYCKDFEEYALLETLQHIPQRPLPKGHKTEQFPLRIATIEEASIQGNLQLHDEVYINQLKQTSERLSTLAIPSFNDQLTNSRIRSAQIIRAQDVDSWERREVFQLGFGLFHLCLNLIWAYLHIHRGSLSQVGSLTYYFALLDKTRLGGEHPDYHTLLSALVQIHDGILLHAWRVECAPSNLSQFAKTKPTAATLLQYAGNIIRDYAMPLTTGETENENEEEGESDVETMPIPTTNANQPSRGRGQQRTLPAETIDLPNPDRDRVHQNTRILLRDLLYLSELIQAISDGDIGRIEAFLPQLAMMFRGAGGNNYCTEILHFIVNLKHVWTENFAWVLLLQLRARCRN